MRDDDPARMLEDEFIGTCPECGEPVYFCLCNYSLDEIVRNSR